MVSDANPPQPEWESALDKQIREAMERGEFDHLRGAGKPLDLTENPHVPADWRLAYKILKDAGAAPDWIEQGKAIRAELQSLAAFVEQHARRQRAQRARLPALAPAQQIAAHEQLTRARARAQQIYRERARALNQRIDTYNLQVPDVNLQLPRVRVADALERL